MPITTPDDYVATYDGDSEHFKHVLKDLFTPAIQRLGTDWTVIPPTMSGSALIHADIIKNLEEADLVLCDVSTRNPNVLFECGIRVALDKPIAMVKDQYAGKVFDTDVINYHEYEASLATYKVEEELPKLTEHLADAVTTSDGHNTFWKVFGLTKRGNLAAPDDPLNVKLDLLINEMSTMRQEQYLRMPNLNALEQHNISSTRRTLRELQMALTIPVNSVLQKHGVETSEIHTSGYGQVYAITDATIDKLTADSIAQELAAKPRAQVTIIGPETTWVITGDTAEANPSPS